MNFEEIERYLWTRGELSDTLQRFSWCIRNGLYEDAMGWQLEFLMLRDELDEEPREVTIGVMRLAQLCGG